MKYIVIALVLYIAQAQVLDERYHTTEELYQYLYELEQNSNLSDWFLIDTIGYSTQENIPILAVKISDNVTIKEDEPRVLYIGQVHAEEILGVEIIVSLINDLLFPNENIYTHMNILKSYLDIWLIPTANPEGLNVVHEGLDLSFRKNKRDFSSDGPFPNGVFDYDPSIGNDIDGVDLNRNFGFNWAFGDTFLEPDNSDYASHYDYYKGTHPFSENESIAIRDLALRNDFVFSIVWHSSRSGNLSEKVFSSWKWEDTKESPDLNIIKPIADQFASNINTEDGTSTYLSVYSGSRNGKLHDWFYQQTGCIQYLVEAGTANLQPDSILIENTIERTKPSMLYLMDRAIGYYADASQLTGLVFDINTGQPIQGARIEILEHSGSILAPRITNEFGRYRRILEVGTYSMQVTAKGYVPQSLTLVANNSAITNFDIYLEPAETHTLTIQFISEINELNSFIGKLSNTFGDSLFTLNNSGHSFILPEDNYELSFEFDGQLMPWESVFYLNENRTFQVPIIEASQQDLIELSNWDLVNGSWSFDNNIITSQISNYYENQDSLISYNWMESGVIETPNANRLVLKINHKYETEWDHDPIKLIISTIDDSTLAQKMWTGHKWENYELDYLSAISNNSFDQVKIRVEFKTDPTVNYRGWKIEDLSLHYINDLFLNTYTEINSSTIKLPFQISSLYPNPSNGRFNLELEGFDGGMLNIKIFNVLGQEIQSIKLNQVSNGKQFFDLNLNNLNGIPTGSGVIFVRVETKKEQVVKKCIIIKN